jgi:hypothetical protein
VSRVFELSTAAGIVWAFNEPMCPLRLASDPTGIEGAPFDFDDQENAGQAGVSFRARNDRPNVIGLDIHVGPVEPGPGAQDLLQRVVSSFGRGKEIHTFTCATETGGARTQLVRLAGGPVALSTSMLTQMRDHGYARIKATFRSDETWFRKAPVVRTLTAAQFAGATVVSESEEPAWPHWVITGPITLPTIGVDGEAVTLPTISVGQTWTIDTDPDYFSIVDQAGTDRSWVGRYWTKPVLPVTPGQATRTVSVTISGTGTTGATRVVLTVPQLFHAGV